MCGVFGFAGEGDPDAAVLEAAALSAGRRGPHGCGWVWLGPGGLRHVHHLGALERAWTTAPVGRRVLGHARLATAGDWRRPEQLQPIVIDGHALAHNGVIRNPEAFATGCATDSIALATAYAQERARGVSPAVALLTLIARADQTAWVIAELDRDGTLVVTRHYHPLWYWRDARGLYLASQDFHPDATLLEEDRIVICH